MRNFKHVGHLLLALGLLASRASGQNERCGQMMLLPLHDRSIQISDENRIFLNVHFYCSLLPQSEEDAREAGIDLAWVYGAVLPHEPPQFKRLQEWAVQGCPTYLGPASDSQLSRAITTVLARATPKVSEAFEQCTESVGLTCYAIPAGRDVVGLFVNWLPNGPQASQDEPEILSAQVIGALLPRDLLDQGFAAGSAATPVRSLEHIKVPRTGLLRSFLRVDRDADVSFEVKTSADQPDASCIPEKVGAVDRRSVVLSVGKPGSQEGSGDLQLSRGNFLWVNIAYLQEGIDELASQKMLPKTEATISDLIPFIDGVPLLGVHPTNLGDKPETDPITGQRIHHLRFDMVRDDENKKSWSQLLHLKTASFSRPVGVTVGFENGATLDTLISNQQGSPVKASLIVIPKFRTVIGSIIIGGALLLFLFLAAKSDIIRDTTAPCRLDGRSPFSLGRTQMAFWFFLVVAAYFGLWMVTGDKDTITSSTVGLIGISATTALGAAIVDALRLNKDEKERPVAPVDPAIDLDQPRTKIKKELNKRRQAVEERLQGLTDPLARQPLESELVQLKKQIKFFSRPSWRRFLDDLLMEDQSISFHKFQIFIWTLILGVIFSAEILQDLAMPEFSGTLLAIMGISGGTYVGFKLPEAQKKDPPVGENAR